MKVGNFYESHEEEKGSCIRRADTALLARQLKVDAHKNQG